MRDPELVMRAQRAAAELERAWDRWRTIHGLGTDPLPPVSSYVGYSLEEPWGQPRVVFGIDAREAELLATLLDRHDFAGPIYAAVASRPGARPGEETHGRPGEPGHGRVRVPTQAPSGAPQRGPETGGQTARPGPQALRTPPGPPVRREDTEPALRAASDADAPGSGADEAPAAREVQDAGNGLVAFRPRRGPAPRDEEGQEPDERAEPGRVPEDDQPTATWTRANRPPGGHALPRQKRAGAAKPSGGKQEAKDRSGLDSLAADLAGWSAGELPGQASHRCPPGQICWQDRHSLG
jgi:hypothetical protein